jgi:hypothetical protein
MTSGALEKHPITGIPCFLARKVAMAERWPPDEVPLTTKPFVKSPPNLGALS